jgi:hypothetical protein
MSTLLTIEISATGIDRIVSRPRSIAEAQTAAALQAKLALPLRLLHETLKESADDPSPESDEAKT